VRQIRLTISSAFVRPLIYRIVSYRILLYLVPNLLSERARTNTHTDCIRRSLKRKAIITTNGQVFWRKAASSSCHPSQGRMDLSDVEPHLTVHLSHSALHRHLDRFSRFLWFHRTAAKIPNAFQWENNSQNWPFSLGEPNPHLIYGSLSLPQSALRTASISIVSAFFAVLTNVTNRQTDRAHTDRPRYTVHSNRPHCGLIIIIREADGRNITATVRRSRDENISNNGSASSATQLL